MSTDGIKTPYFYPAHISVCCSLCVTLSILNKQLEFWGYWLSPILAITIVEKVNKQSGEINKYTCHI